MICDLLESTYDFADAPRPAHSGALMPAEVSVMRSCLQAEILLPYTGCSGAIKPLYPVLRLPEFRFTYVQQGVQKNAQSDHALMHVPQSQSG